MSPLNRRDFLRTTSLGLAAAGVGTLALRAGAQPTPETPDAHDYRQFLDEQGTPRIEPTGEFEPTEYNTPGPFYRSGAPYRAKVSPPLAAGTALVITGRIWSHETRRPLAGALLDIWQADARGRYDNDDRDNPPAPAPSPTAHACSPTKPATTSTRRSTRPRTTPAASPAPATSTT